MRAQRLRRLRSSAGGEEGFTLIEILVVILIIGILAGIALGAFLGQRSKGYDAQAKAQLNTGQTAMETYGTDNRGSYASATAASLTSIEPALNNAPAVAVSGASSTGYTLSATAQGGSSTIFTLVDSSGTITRSCSNAGVGGCKSGGSW